MDGTGTNLIRQTCSERLPETMLIPVHANIGWLLAEAGRGTRRFRQAVLLASVLPDLDGLLTFYSQHLYHAYHSRLTHSLPFSLMVSGLAAMLCRNERAKVALFTQVAFYLHYFGDYVFSGWPQAFWFPFSDKVYVFDNAFWLEHPVNYAIWIASTVLVFLVAWMAKRTPIEAVSTRLDDRFSNFLFRDKLLECSVCGRKTNERCRECAAPVCIRHAPLNAGFEPRCAHCSRRGTARDIR